LPAVRGGIERRSGGLSGKWKNISGWLAAIVILDQLTKVVVDRTIALYQSIAIVDGLFSFTYVRNPGAAFGIFAGHAAIYRRPFLILVSILASGFIVILLKRLDGRERGLITALTFILGGAVGNLIDRVFYGEVIDFLDVYWRNYHWPAFNVADSFITIGVAVALFYLYKHKGDDPFAGPVKADK
jgi:signal peptidase II